jgi:twitching motility protein PilI
MNPRQSLRDYQRELSERLRAPDSARIASKLAVQAGAEGWLVELTEAGEIIPVPPIAPVARARPWFRGVANVRGNLCTVVDFAAFLGGALSSLTEHSRVLLVGARYRTGAALLVERSLGLRNPAQLKEVARENAEPWRRARYEDADGKHWSELDVGGLVQHEQFLNAGY